MHRFVRARPVARAVACALIVFAQSIPFHATLAHAAGPAAEFAVSPTQMQSLGVTLQKLEQPAAIRGMAYPAKVVLPPSEEQLVSAPVDGVVDRLMVSGQESVKAGQPLVRLVSPEYGDLQLKLMEAASKSRLSRKTLEREKQLFGEGIIPERRVQEAEAAERADAARLRQAEAELRLAGADVALIKRVAGGGRLEDGLMVRAKTAGLVLAVDAKPGQRVKEADPLVRLANLRELWLDIQVPADRPTPKSGEITVVGRDVAATPLSAGAMVSDSQTVTLRAKVIKGAQLLRPGEVVQAQVPFPASEGWALPLQAVTRQDDKAYVFVRSAKGFVATPVTVLSSAGQSVQVSGNLKAGQEVATASVIALKSAWLGKGGGS
ncbi:MAG: efflux RND transporter periplasmic adaptor subunit [Burkholderiales bacterium]|nr:efflux RND transporter periplasmic adaptor subunit [Burkholderiales bacterium]